MFASVLEVSYRVLERAETLVEVNAEMGRLAKLVGFDKFSYSLSIARSWLERRPLLVIGHPQARVDRYVELDLAVFDPLLQHAVCSTLPAMWNEERLQRSRGKSVRRCRAEPATIEKPDR